MPNCSSAELNLRVAWGDLPSPPRIEYDQIKSIFLNALTSNLTRIKRTTKPTSEFHIHHPIQFPHSPSLVVVSLAVPTSPVTSGRKEGGAESPVRVAPSSSRGISRAFTGSGGRLGRTITWDPPNGKCGKSSTQKCRLVGDMLVSRRANVFFLNSSIMSRFLIPFTWAKACLFVAVGSSLPPSFWVSMVDAWCDAGGVESIDLILRMTHSLLGVAPFHFVQYHTPFPDQEIWRTCLNLLYILYIIHDRVIHHTSGRINYYYSSIFSHSSEPKLLLGRARPLWRGGPWQPLLQGRCRGTGPWRDAAAAIRDAHLHRCWGTSTWSETKEPQLLWLPLFFLGQMLGGAAFANS